MFAAKFIKFRSCIKLFSYRQFCKSSISLLTPEYQLLCHNLKRELQSKMNTPIIYSCLNKISAANELRQMMKMNDGNKVIWDIQKWFIANLRYMTNEEAKQGIRHIFDFYFARVNGLVSIDQLCIFIQILESKISTGACSLKERDTFILFDFILKVLNKTSTAGFALNTPANVLEILKTFNLVKHKYKIDIVIIDKLLESTFNILYKDNSKDAVRFVKIINEISELNYIPTTDLIDTIINIYIDENFRECPASSTPFEHSLLILKSIAKLERKIGDQMLLPYIDRYEEFYQKEIDVIKTQFELNDMALKDLIEILCMIYYRDDELFQRAADLSYEKVNKLLEIIQNKYADKDKFHNESAKRSFNDDFGKLFGELSRIHKHCNHMGVFPGQKYMDQTLTCLELFSEADERYSFDLNCAGFFCILQRACAMHLQNTDERVCKLIDFMISYNFRKNKDSIKLEYLINLEKILLYFKNIQNSQIKDKISSIVAQDK